MDSSSTLSIHKGHQFDVFLSFRGEDTRKNFVDHLYEALQSQGIRTFKDNERLEKGKRINDEILKSLDDSKLCIIVFSKNYASSSWCLDELVKIMESHKDTAYPVFYDVDPSEVRKQSWSVRDFARHVNEEVIGKWSEALREAANLSGWDLRKTADGHEAKVIKLIVHQISLELRSINVDINENLVGMEHRMQNLYPCLEIGSNDVRMIGIKGMGGAGKTTLARAIFDRLSIQFEANSFVENVREVSKLTVSALLSLQRQVLSDLLKDQVHVSSVHDAKKIMQMRLFSKKVLLVLDDVDRIDQLEALAGAPNWFKPGSRIIITTRDEQVLIAHKVNMIRDVTLLSDEEAILLFSRHAFGGDFPIQDYATQSLEVVHYAAGLPLTIRVLGSSLCGKNKLEWTDALKRLRTIPLKETLEKLELSYESLEEDYKEIFLDVTCFMKGLDKDYGIKILENCGFHARNGLRVLEQRSLIAMKGDIIDMHDHIEELGKNIVRRLHPDEPHKHSRLWIQEEIEDILANDMGTEATRCVHIYLTDEIDLEGLGKMKKLRWLEIHGYSDGEHVTIDEASQCFPSSLRRLSWSHYPHWCLPKTFRASNLVALNMSCSRIKLLWPHGEGKVLKKLKYLDLGHSQIRMLDLGLTPNLESLYLVECKDLEELQVPVGCLLRRLVNLNLFGCKRLKSLSFIKQLESLEILSLYGLSLTKFPEAIPDSLQVLYFCFNDIEDLPSSIGNLHKLVFLDLSCCKKLKNLPRSLYSLQHLQTLKLMSCGIEELLEDLGQLKSLVQLNLSFCNFRDIPRSICMLKHLKILDLSGCKQIENLPNELGDLECLEELYAGSTTFKHLPDSICMLKHLKVLSVSRSALEHFPEDAGKLDSLETLDLSYCNIRDIPRSIGMLKHLQRLDLYRCKKLENLPDELGDIECLEYLYIEGTCISHLPHNISLLEDSETDEEVPNVIRAV